ncbi:MAG: cytochrome D1 domain-containing protein [Myxococcota bacterium]
MHGSVRCAAAVLIAVMHLTGATSAYGEDGPDSSTERPEKKTDDKAAPDAPDRGVAATWQVTRTARTKSMPWGVSVSRDGARVYVTHVGMRGRDNVYRYDADTLEVQARSRFPGHAVESIPAGEILYASDSRRDRIMLLDSDTLAVRSSLRAAAVPKDIALSPDGATLYTANWRAGSVSFIDVASGRASHVATGRNTRGVTVSRDGRTVYATIFGARKVVLLDAATGAITGSIQTCAKPRHVAVTHDDAWLLVTCFGDKTMLVVDRADHTIARRLTVGRGPKTVALAPDGRFAVTADEVAGTITVVDLRTWKTRSFAVPARQPCGVTVAPDSQKIYVTARGSNRLLVFEPGPAAAEK